MSVNSSDILTAPSTFFCRNSNMAITHIYRHRFFSLCPNNGKVIEYRLTITTVEPVRIMVEHIVTACALHRAAYQEDIAVALEQRFGDRGVVTLEAHHHGVDIESVTA